MHIFQHYLSRDGQNHYFPINIWQTSIQFASNRFLNDFSIFAHKVEICNAAHQKQKREEGSLQENSKENTFVVSTSFIFRYSYKK